MVLRTLCHQNLSFLQNDPRKCRNFILLNGTNYLDIQRTVGVQYDGRGSVLGFDAKKASNRRSAHHHFVSIPYYGFAWHERFQMELVVARRTHDPKVHNGISGGSGAQH
mmetsp:Transcript_33673/g.33942  ORF Transcript_33673/g.33942 Transcript_33673/m.33942 type:complete len:109 (-) Transcript_33673:37-363(-)